METQALIVAFDQLRGHDEVEQDARLAGVRMPAEARPASERGS